MASRAETLRARVAEGGPRRPGRRIDATTRQEVIEYAREQLRNGSSLAAIARDIDISPFSLGRWLEAPGFVAVEVCDPEPGTVVVKGPFGLLIEGLSLSQVAELLRSLA